jgi:hypothetical protein
MMESKEFRDKKDWNYIRRWKGKKIWWGEDLDRRFSNIDAERDIRWMVEFKNKEKWQN